MKTRRLNRIFIHNVASSRVIWGYLFFLAATGWGVFSLESVPQKALLILMQLVLFVLPLLSVIFTTVYYYNSQEFIALLLAQPIRRTSLVRAMFIGLALVQCLVLIIGVGIPVLVYHPSAEGLVLMLGGVFLSVIFTGIGLFIGTGFRDKSQGLGSAIVVWAFFAFVYDGLLILFMYQLADFPIEVPVLVLSFLNPIDIARVMVIMRTEAAALLGLSGAIFRDFFGSSRGFIVSVVALMIWAYIPFLLALRRFNRRDL